MVTGPPTPARPPGPPQPPTHAGPRSRPLTLRTLGGLERTTGATSSPLIHQRGAGEAASWVQPVPGALLALLVHTQHPRGRSLQTPFTAGETKAQEAASPARSRGLNPAAWRHRPLGSHKHTRVQEPPPSHGATPGFPGWVVAAGDVPQPRPLQDQLCFWAVARRVSGRHAKLQSQRTGGTAAPGTAGGNVNERGGWAGGPA